MRRRADGAQRLRPLAQVKLDPAEYTPLLAPLLDIPLPPERASALPPEELRRRQLAALTNWVIESARTQPLVLALEDLHRADPTTLDFLHGIAERGALAPLFVLNGRCTPSGTRWAQVRYLRPTEDLDFRVPPRRPPFGP